MPLGLGSYGYSLESRIIVELVGVDSGIVESRIDIGVGWLAPLSAEVKLTTRVPFCST